MKQVEPEPLACTRDSSYGRLLRRLDQALDVARTRQWMAGRQDVPAELEVYGLSRQDVQLLQQILGTMHLKKGRRLDDMYLDSLYLNARRCGRTAASPSVLAARDCAQQQRSQY